MTSELTNQSLEKIRQAYREKRLMAQNPDQHTSVQFFRGDHCCGLGAFLPREEFDNQALLSGENYRRFGIDPNYGDKIMFAHDKWFRHAQMAQQGVFADASAEKYHAEFCELVGLPDPSDPIED